MHDHQLCSGFRGFAGFADDVEQCVLKPGIESPDLFENGTGEIRVHIVEDEQSRPISFLVGKKIPGQRSKSVMKCHRAKRTSPDSEDHDRLHITVPVDQMPDCFDVCAANRVMGQVSPGGHALPGGRVDPFDGFDE